MSPPSPNVDTVGEPGHNDLKPAVLQTEDREGPILRSAEDDLSVWQGVRRFKRAGCIAMLAAFSAALDGYRKISIPPVSPIGHFFC